MQTEAAARCVHSLSSLYAADEVELLLEELRELEPRAGQDIQDFEIAGSQTGVVGVGVGGVASWSPDGTVHSWDSHPHYRRTPPPPPARVAPLYCHAHHLATPPGALRLLLAVCSLCCVWLEYLGGGSGMWLLPHAGRLRLLLATALFSLMASLALLFLDVSRLVHLFPFNWAKLNAWLYISVGAAYLLSGSLCLSATLSDDFWWLPDHTINMLIAASCLGLVGSVLSGTVALVYCYRRPSISSGAGGGSSALLAPSRSPSPSPRPGYLPVPSRDVPPPPEPTPGSSKTPL